MEAISRIAVLLFVLSASLSPAFTPQVAVQGSIRSNEPEQNTVPGADEPYLAIVDVYVTNQPSSTPAPPYGDANYTGLGMVPYAVIPARYLWVES